MVRKYLNRYKNQEFDQDVEEVQDAKRSAKLRELEDNFDPSNVAARTLSFSSEEILPREEEIKQEIKKTKFHMKVTGNYQDVLNTQLKEKLAKIDKIKQAKQQFDSEIEALKGNPSNQGTNLDVPVLSELEIRGLQQLLQTELINYNIVKSNLEHYRKKAYNTMKELDAKEKTISKIKEEIEKREEKISGEGKKNDDQESNLHKEQFENAASSTVKKEILKEK